MSNLDSSRLRSRDPLANWNGELMPLSEVRVSVLDRGFLFGDAIYEVIRIFHGKPFHLEAHLARLERNLEKIRIVFDVGQIAERIAQTVSAAGFEDAVIYVQVTRGVAPRTHQFPSPPVEPNVLIYVAEYQDRFAAKREQGASVMITKDLRWKRCDIKSVNLLANCLAKEEAYAAGCVEALLVDEAGKILEGSSSSLFGVRQGVVLTAPLGENILPGITRTLLMKLCQDSQVPMQEESIFQNQLDEIDELIITSTTMDLLPVTRVDGMPIGDGTIGPVAKKLIQAYQQMISESR